MTSLDLSKVASGFSDPVHQAQASFRALMDGMSRPGRMQTLTAGPQTPPEGMDVAASAVALTLLDLDTPVWLDDSLRGSPAETFIRFHCGCPLTEDPQEAAFAIAPVGSTRAHLNQFNIGSEKYPDRSTTLIWMCPSLTGGAALTLRGPGIRDQASLAPQGLPADFVSVWRENQRQFQCGVDLVLTSGRDLVALPRSIIIN